MKIVKVSAASPTIYCARADQGETASHDVRGSELAECLKVNAIIADHVYVSANHLLGSETTLRVLEGLGPLAETGAVVVGLREDCPDLHAYTDRFLESRGLPEGSDVAKTIRLRTKRAEALLTHAVQWNPPTQQKQFKESLVASLGARESVLRRRLTAVPVSAINELSASISDLPDEDVSRRSLIRLARRFIPHRIRAIGREINLLNYTVGSSKAGLVLDLHPTYFDDMSSAAKNSLVAGTIPQDEMVRELLDALVLPSELVAQLAPESVVKLRTEYRQDLRAFRSVWWNSMHRQHDSGGGMAEGLRIRGLIRDVVALEARKLRRYARVSHGISVGSLVVSLASLIPVPTLAALSFAVTLVSTAAGSESVKNRVLGSHLHVLGTRLQRLVGDGNRVR